MMTSTPGSGCICQVDLSSLPEGDNATWWTLSSKRCQVSPVSGRVLQNRPPLKSRHHTYLKHTCHLSGTWKSPDHSPPLTSPHNIQPETAEQIFCSPRSVDHPPVSHLKAQNPTSWSQVSHPAFCQLQKKKRHIFTYLPVNRLTCLFDQVRCVCLTWSGLCVSLS